MTQSNNSTSQPRQVSLVKRMLVGAGIGLLLISPFLLSDGEPNPVGKAMDDKTADYSSVSRSNGWFM